MISSNRDGVMTVPRCTVDLLSSSKLNCSSGFSYLNLFLSMIMVFDSRYCFMLKRKSKKGSKKEGMNENNIRSLGGVTIL